MRPLLPLFHYTTRAELLGRLVHVVPWDQITDTHEEVKGVWVGGEKRNGEGWYVKRPEAAEYHIRSPHFVESQSVTDVKRPKGSDASGSNKGLSGWARWANETPGQTTPA